MSAFLMRWQRNNEARGKRFHLDETNLAPFPIPMKQQKLNNALEGLFQSSLKCSCGSIGNTNMNFPWDWPFFTLHLQHYMNAYLNEKHILSECGNDKEGRKKNWSLILACFCAVESCDLLSFCLSNCSLTSFCTTHGFRDISSPCLSW